MKQSFGPITPASLAIVMAVALVPGTAAHASTSVDETRGLPPATAPANIPLASEATGTGSVTPQVTEEPANQGVSTRGDVRQSARPTARQRKIAKARVVWGFASIGHKGSVRGGKVTVRSIRNKPLRAEVLTKKTNKRGFYAVSRLGLPKRFVVAVTGGKVPVKSGKKTVWRATNTTLLTAVGKPRKGFARHTAADATLGTTVAALTGVRKYRDAGDARAAARARKALRLPAHATLGTYDRLLPHHVTAKKVRAQARSKGGLGKFTNELVRRASRGGQIGTGLGEGKRAKFRIKVEAGRNGHRVGTRGVNAPTDILADAVEIGTGVYEYASAGISLYKQAMSFLSLLGLGGESAEAKELAAIDQRLTQIGNQLTNIQSQIATLQDEMEGEFAELSLQLSQTQYDVLAEGGTSIAAQANYAMQQMQYLSNIATPSTSFLMPGQINEVNGLLANLSGSAASTTLQRDLVGGTNAPGVLGSAWSLIRQSRGVAAPATSSDPTAVTTLLTHENYDAFSPVVAQWYLAQIQLSVLMTNYTMNQDLASADGWVLTGNDYELSPTAQAIYNFSMNGMCPASPAPCPGSFNSYLQVLSDSMPSKTLGASEAIDPTTGLKWGNFGIVNWNAVTGAAPSVNSPDLTRPPTANVVCNGQSRQLQLDQDFFKTVNGTDDGCSWPGAPVGGPVGSNDSASDWQMLSSDPGSGGTYDSTLGSLAANIRTGGTGLLSQIDNANQTQKANPSLNFAGVSAADFTSPSLFPDTGWGRFVYSKGEWQQFMWNDDGTARVAGLALFPWHDLVPARKSAGDFLVFDILNPTRPSLAAAPFKAACEVDPVDPASLPSGFSNASCMPGTGVGASLIASDVPWADYASSFQYLQNNVNRSTLGPANRSFQSDVSYAFKDSSNPSQLTIAGLAAPWWPMANYSHDGDQGSSMPATPGCSTSSNRPWSQGGVGKFEVGDTCSASVIGTRQITVSDYEWQQPASIG